MAHKGLEAESFEIDWNDRNGKPFAVEKRTLRAFRQPAGEALIEFESTLEAVDKLVHLDGDLNALVGRQRAGLAEVLGGDLEVGG